MAQRLLPSTKAGVKVVPATEVLLASPSVSDRIREGHEEDLYAIIAVQLMMECTLSLTGSIGWSPTTMSI